jgi:transposase
MRDLTGWQRGQTVGAHLVVASVTKTATSLGVSRAAVSKVMTTCTNHEKTSSAKRSSGRKPKLSERDRQALKRIVSKNRRTAAPKVTAELNIRLEYPFTTVYITWPSSVCPLVTKQAMTLDYKQEQNTAYKGTNMADVTRVVDRVSLRQS